MHSRLQMIALEEQQEFERRRKLIQQARKGNETAKGRLFDLYQVKFYSAKDMPREDVEALYRRIALR